MSPQGRTVGLQARGPLHGVTVLDCSRGTAGTQATGILADYGADVIWVEPPGGDPWREQLAIPYAAFNRGKRSVVLDLRSEGGRDRIHSLLETADVFVLSWRPDVAGELGLDPNGLRARFPALVTCSITGFGDQERYRDVPGYEALVHALVGSMGEQVGHREGPIFEGLPFASIGAAYLAVIGTLAALVRREDDGWGRHVETSVFDGALAYLSMLWGDSDAARPPVQPGAHRLVTRSFLCADDAYLGVHTGAVGAFGRLMQVLGLDDRIPPSESGIDMGQPLTPEQQEILARESVEIFASRPCSFWIDELRRADVCAIPHLHPTEVYDEPQVRHNEMVLEIDDPALGRIRQVGPPLRFSGARPAIPTPAPTAGQHGDAAFATGSRRPTPSGSSPDSRPILHGVKVLDLGAFYAGPYSSRLLADLGADVIKVEPIAGDPLRGLSAVFRSASAGKRSIALDLKDPDTAPALRGLVEWCDVLHHNLRPGAAERLGVDDDRVRTLNPNVVYLYAPGWGSTGPDSNRQSFAPMLSGYVGCGFEVAGQFNPPLFPAGNEDPGNGLLGAVAMLIGLLHRRRTGEGISIENPQLNASLVHTAHIVRTCEGEVLGAGRLDPLQLGFDALERLYQTADGWLCIAAKTESQARSLLGLPGIELASDARFATRPARQANDAALAALLDGALRERSTADWLSSLPRAGVPAAEPVPHNAIAFLRDPENRRNGRVGEASHPDEGRVRGIAKLVRVGDAASVPYRAAPSLGEHTDEILAQLGYGTGKIDALRERGVVR